MARTHPSAAKQALLLCFLEPVEGGSSGSSAVTAAEMLAANPAYSGEISTQSPVYTEPIFCPLLSYLLRFMNGHFFPTFRLFCVCVVAAVSMLELAAHAAVLRHPPNSPRGTLNTAVAALAQTPYSPRAGDTSAAASPSYETGSPSPRSMTHLSATSAASAAKCAKLFAGGAVVGNGLRALVVIANGLAAKQLVFNGFQALLDQGPPTNPQRAEECKEMAAAANINNSGESSSLKAAMWSCLQVVHRAYRPPGAPLSGGDDSSGSGDGDVNGGSNLRRCRVGSLVHVPYHSSLQLVVEWPRANYTTTTTMEDEEAATNASERAWRESRSQSNANPLVNPPLSGSSSNATTSSARFTSSNALGGTTMKARVRLPNAVFGAGTFVRAMVVAVQSGAEVSSSSSSSSSTTAATTRNNSTSYTLAYFDGPFAQGDEPPVPPPRIVKESLQRYRRRSAMTAANRRPLPRSSVRNDKIAGPRKFGGLSREQWDQLALFRLPSQTEAAFTLISVKRHLFEVTTTAKLRYGSLLSNLF